MLIRAACAVLRVRSRRWLLSVRALSAKGHDHEDKERPEGDADETGPDER